MARENLAVLGGTISDVGWPYPEELKRRVRSYALTRRSEGATVDAISKELGIAFKTLKLWLASDTFRAVSVVSSDTYDAARPHSSERLSAWHVASGLRIDDLKIEQVVELVKRLS